jgi:putative transposase
MIILVEQHIIRRTDARFAAIDAAAFAAKNLYNKANYLVRQSFFQEGRMLWSGQVYHQLKDSVEYKALPRKVSCLVLRQLDHNWHNFFAALKVWRQAPEKFLACPGPPGYKPKKTGRFMLLYDRQALSRPALRDGIIKPSQLGIEIKTRQTNVKRCRIVPRLDHYVVEVIYEVEPQPAPHLNEHLVAGLDPGIDNLAAIVANKPNFVPVLVNGRPLKSINQFYNKRMAYLQSKLPPGRHWSHKIARLTLKRNLKVKHYLHQASRTIINLLVQEGIGTLVIGRNLKWKQRINMGSSNNQKFLTIPHTKFYQMLTYKAQLVGIKVVFQEESYTSRCSFLDLEPIGKSANYTGRRIQRGLFRSVNGQHINADVNAAYNIIRKAVPDAFADGIEGVAVRPVRTTLTK